VINAVMLKMASGVIGGFEVNGFWPAVFGALIISLVSWLLNMLINDRGEVDVIDLRHKGGNRWE
jgi:putative membrane protein